MLEVDLSLLFCSQLLLLLLGFRVYLLRVLQLLLLLVLHRLLVHNNHVFKELLQLKLVEFSCGLSAFFEQSL